MLAKLAIELPERIHELGPAQGEAAIALSKAPRVRAGYSHFLLRL